MRLASLAVDGGFHPALVLGEEALDLVSARAINAAARLLPAGVVDLEAGHRIACPCERHGHRQSERAESSNHDSGGRYR